MCQVKVYDQGTRDKRMMMDYCVGKISKKKYSKIVYKYKEMTKKHRTATDKRAIRKADKALKSKTVKWVSDKEQKLIDDIKFGTMVGGSIAAGLIFQVLALGTFTSVYGIVGAILA